MGRQRAAGGPARRCAGPGSSQVLRPCRVLGRRGDQLTEFQFQLIQQLAAALMPNIWGDDAASCEFIGSFFEDVAWRASGAGGPPRIVKALQDGLGDRVNISDPDKARQALEARLADRPWTNAAWMESEDDEKEGDGD
jgi:hypothetical protein